MVMAMGRYITDYAQELGIGLCKRLYVFLKAQPKEWAEIVYHGIICSVNQAQTGLMSHLFIVLLVDYVKPITIAPHLECAKNCDLRGMSHEYESTISVCPISSE